MIYLRKADIIKSIFRVRFLNKKIPLAIRWQLTDLCLSQCKYCKIWKVARPRCIELPTKTVLKILDEVSIYGTKKISFSGGEPLLREDIGKIIDYCKEKGISPELNSNGYLVHEKIKEIKNLDLLKLSLDGPPDIHDVTRGWEGSHKMVIDAAASAKSNNINFIFTTTLTKFNIGHIEYILQLTKEFNTMVAFQPLKDIKYLEFNNVNNNIRDIKEIFPTPQEFKKAIDIIIYYKKQWKWLMRNSLRGLNHIYNWPHYKPLRCWAGRIFCIIDTDGTISPCDRLKYNQKLPNCAEIGFWEAFTQLFPPPPCEGCGFCGTLELNYLMAFKFDIPYLMGKLKF